MPKEPKDARSTGRKRARAVLEQAVRDGLIKYECSVCHRNPVQYPNLVLDADHENKNILDNDLANLSWKCRSCHKESDQRTAKGVSTVDESLTRGYGNYD